MKYKNTATLGLLLFCITSSVYGYLTGTNFFIRRIMMNSPIYDFVVISVILFSIYGVVVFSLRELNSGIFNCFNWLLPILSGFFPMMFSWVDADLGAIFRFYLAPASFFMLLAFAIYSIWFLKAQKNIIVLTHGVFVILVVLVFTAGVVIYVAKGGINFERNHNFAMQFLLSMLCVVMPSFYSLIAIRLKLLK